ncbi:Bgt-51984 [Blumeria graminis f. sp. tritici]|uniref:Bgt-51984 n=1 Tax=Blumeria graminis f. sp. tritici TaxID=62690 RepID=A0A9X9QDG1_BLUGR|nr:Bgt-51984 [Blumeria graminis f. sp. tritici]
MVSMRPWLSVMQDNSPAHVAASTMEDTNQRLIQPVFWQANSPDLNPIEAVWNRMKDYI